MSKVLRGAPFGDRPRLVAFGAVDPGLPEHVRALIASAGAEAFERGRNEGRRQGLAEAAAQAEALAGPVAAALRGGLDELRQQRQADHADLVALAVAVARAVTEGDVRPAGQAVLDDVCRALDGLDDTPLTVLAHPGDAAFLVSGLGSRPGVLVVPDPALAPGDARIRGPWARADVTRAARWAAVGEALGLPPEALGKDLAHPVAPQPGDVNRPPQDFSG